MPTPDARRDDPNSPLPPRAALGEVILAGMSWLMARLLPKAFDRLRRFRKETD
jgi:hypothetical protein